MIDIDTLLRVTRGISKTEIGAVIEVFQTLRRPGYVDAPPPTVSDGWGGIREAMVEVYGKVPKYSGRDRPATRKCPQPGWRYLQMVKRPKNGRVAGTRSRVIFGDEAEVLDLLGEKPPMWNATISRCAISTVAWYPRRWATPTSLKCTGQRLHGRTPCTTWPAPQNVMP